MQALYQTAAAGVNSTAATPASLHARLHQMPPHDIHTLQPQATLHLVSKDSETLTPLLSTSAGQVLHHQMPEVVWPILHELAHAIGQHSEASWASSLLGVFFQLLVSGGYCMHGHFTLCTLLSKTLGSIIT